MKITKLVYKIFAVLIISPFLMSGFCVKDKSEPITPIDNGGQFFTWNILGQSGQIDESPGDSLGMKIVSDTTVIYGTRKTNTLTANYRLTFPGTKIGNYKASEFLIYASGRYLVATSKPIDISISSYGGPGSFVTGSYSGPIKDSTSGITITATGEFKVKNK